MRGTPIYKEVNLSSVKFESILEEIQRNSFTGYMKLSYWDMEDYVFYLRGRQVGGVRQLSEGMREAVNYEVRSPKSEKGVFSLYATSPVEVFSFKESVEDRITPYTFATYGEEFVAPIQLAHTNINSLFKEAEELYINGHMLLTGAESFEAHITLAGGKPVSLWDSKDYTHSGSKSISVDPQNSYICAFRTEPEFSSFLASLDTLKSLENIKLRSVADVKGVMANLSDGFRLLELVFSYGLRLFILLLGKSPLLKLVNDCGEVSKDKLIAPANKEYLLRIYSIEIRSEYTPINLSLNTLSQEVNYLSQEDLSSIRRVFVEEIGPIGAVVWKRIFEVLGFEVDKLPKQEVNKFINMLANEIPDEKHSKRFLEKTRRWLS